MNEKKIWLYGAGGHAAVVEATLKKLNWEIAGAFDDNAKPGSQIIETNIIGDYTNLSTMYFSGMPDIHIAIGTNLIRKNLYEKLCALGFCFSKIVHPTAVIELGSSIEAGSFIAANAVVGARAQIGKACIINTAASVDHDCQLANFVHICPGVRLAGNVKVGELTTIGTGAVVIPGVKIGKNCMIGAGTVVLKDVPDNKRIVGNPGRLIQNKGV